MTMAPPSASKEQVALVNEIWDVSCLLNPKFKWEALKVLVQADDEILPEHRLRRILLQLKDKHRKGTPKVKAEVSEGCEGCSEGSDLAS